MTPLDALALCAQGECDLQAALHGGLGSRWLVEDRLGWAPDGVPHRYLLGAVTLSPDLPADRMTALAGTVCDSFAALPSLPGRVAERENLFMLRPAGPPPPVPAVPGLTITRVTTDEQVTRWEHTTFVANGAPPQRPGELHPPGSQHHPGVTLLLATLDGAPVGTSMVVVGERCTTASAVAVMPGARRRGIAGALLAESLALAPHLPATLSSSEEGAGVYRRLGYTAVSRPLHWAPA